MIVPGSGKQNLITVMDWKCVSDGSLFDLFIQGGSDANTLTEANKRSQHLLFERNGEVLHFVRLCISL